MVKLVKGIDIRQVGSGNPGATNVSRALGRPYGILVFILDMLKGFLPVFAFDQLFSGYGHSLATILCAIGVICGHTFPIFLGFKGGKAAATGCGVFLGSPLCNSLLQFLCGCSPSISPGMYR